MERRLLSLQEFCFCIPLCSLRRGATRSSPATSMMNECGSRRSAGASAAIHAVSQLVDRRDPMAAVVRRDGGEHVRRRTYRHRRWWMFVGRPSHQRAGRYRVRAGEVEQHTQTRRNGIAVLLASTASAHDGTCPLNRRRSLPWRIDASRTSSKRSW